MSINIKTASGLQKLTPEVTKSTISSALGYTPTDDTKLNEHAGNSDIHVTTSDKTRWNNKSEFSGSYSDLIDKPNIVEDNSDNFTLTDDAGNKIFQVDSTGTHNLDVFIGSMDNEKSVSEHIEDTDIHITSTERTAWDKTTTDLSSHTENSNIHVTSSDKSKWNNKSDFSGNYNDLEGKPNIVDGGEGSKELDIADSNGNVIVKVNSEGIQTPEVTLFTSAGKVKVSEELYDIDDALSNHINNPRVHFSGKFSDLEESPIVDDGRGNFAIADSSNNVAFEVSSNGITNAAKLSVGGKDIETIIEEHIDAIPEVVIPDTATVDKITHLESWNGDPTTLTVNPDNIVWSDISYFTVENNGSEEDFEFTSGWRVPLAAGDNVTLTKTDDETAVKINADVPTTLSELTGDSTHRTVTDTEKSTWNNKSDFSGAYVDLTGKPNITDDGAAEYHITDNSGNIIFTVDSEGAKTTGVQIYKKDSNGNLVTDDNDNYIAQDVGTAIAEAFSFATSEAEWANLTAQGYADAMCLAKTGGTVSGPLTITGILTCKERVVMQNSAIISGTLGVTSNVGIEGDLTCADSSGNKTNITAGTITATDFNSVSDARLKTNIEDYTPTGNILDLPLKEFDYIKSNVHTIGCLAQDLVKIAPELVDTDKEGFMSIKESKLVYLLLFELQKMNKRLDDLEGELNNGRKNI